MEALLAPEIQVMFMLLQAAGLFSKITSAKTDADQAKSQIEEEKKKAEDKAAELQRALDTITKQQQGERLIPLESIPVTEYRNSPELLAKVEAYEQSIAEHRQQLDALTQRLADNNKMDSVDDLKKNDERVFNALVKVAEKAKPIPLDGIQIAFFGIVSSGKSTMVNSCIGKDVAKTGIGETTTIQQPYKGKGFVIWDIPGRHDKLSYFTLKYLGLWKGLTHRVIFIKESMKLMMTVCELMEALKLRYTIVVNRVEQKEAVSDEEEEAFRQQIRNEVIACNLKKADKKVFFIDAKQPLRFKADWDELLKKLMAMNVVPVEEVDGDE